LRDFFSKSQLSGSKLKTGVTHLLIPTLLQRTCLLPRYEPVWCRATRDLAARYGARQHPDWSDISTAQPTVGESLTKAKDNVVAAVHTSTAPPPPTATEQLKDAAAKVWLRITLKCARLTPLRAGG